MTTKFENYLDSRLLKSQKEKSLENEENETHQNCSIKEHDLNNTMSECETDKNWNQCTNSSFL